ncbi:hypothetical protein E1264_03050 [Actinomadura sp. KC216]|uniref:hypothetical protein n=1 Tax=Actinomadura sp. KC216 TaxID=2530370 RepID=UPI001042C8FA|nr:hypothetical protein [Actinomadura sp. KC216]TDB90993.1 hypothetical protein E1264_03050 [Actinomadura sp. KC216]
MSVIAYTSPGDAPGATTTAFAMALTWPGRVLLAECSPAGGQILRGYFQCHTSPVGGLWDLALAAVHGPDVAETALWEQTIALDDERQHLLLPGLVDPFLATEFSAATWDNLAATFSALPFTALADTGPISPEQPFALLRAAELVVVVMRPTLAQVAAARPRIARLRQALGPTVPLALYLIGERPYTMRDLRAELGEFAMTATMPIDGKAASLLSQGGGSDRARRRIEVSPLMRAARTATNHALNFTTAQRRALTGPSSGRTPAVGERRP